MRRGFDAEHAAARAEAESRADVHRLFQHVRNRWDENDQATRDWRAAIARNDRDFMRVYPASFWEALEDLRQAPIGDAPTRARHWTPARAESIEVAIRFLEADVICFRSGYVKERLIRRLVRQSLAPADVARLRTVVLDVLDRRGGRDFRAYCRLAVRVADAALTTDIASRATSAADADLRRRAGWMREAIAIARRGTV